MKANDFKLTSKEFKKHLKNCEKLIKNWPQWKRDVIIAKSNKPHIRPQIPRNR